LGIPDFRRLPLPAASTTAARDRADLFGDTRILRSWTSPLYRGRVPGDKPAETMTP
jgi:hypothetical protein